MDIKSLEEENKKLREEVQELKDELKSAANYSLSRG